MDMLKTPSGGSASAGGHIFLLQQPIMGSLRIQLLQCSTNAGVLLPDGDQ